MNGYDFDVVVIGGGIHGAGTAQAAAAAGYAVALLEQADLGHGSSSRSSKLIHGGLRYLEQRQFRLVRESLRERTLLLELAPGLVRLIAFHIPVYAGMQRKSWQLALGLGLYWALSGFRRDSRFQIMPESDWASLDGVQRDGLIRVFRYFDAQTDDLALTRAVMRSAQTLGAELIMPARFTGAELADNGCLVHYAGRGRESRLRCRVMINAAGPWAPRVLAAIQPQLPAPRVELVRGAHIIMPERLQRGVYYLEAPSDRRAVFAMPYGEHSLIGTTEARYTGDPANVQTTREECRYLAEIAGYYFPGWEDVEPLDEFAGLRVLPVTGGKSLSARSRETLLAADRTGRPRLVSILGGKLTTYRATAERLLALISTSLPKRRRLADTRTLPLTSPEQT